MQLTVTVNYGEMAAAMGLTKTMIRNLGEGVPTAIKGMLDTTAKTASGLTHRGATGKLQAGWKVDQQKFNFSLYNIMPYASDEFSRKGDKLAGKQPYGPHNPIPTLIDMITGNIENIVGKAIFAGATR
jgi:hypothetical protein